MENDPLYRQGLAHFGRGEWAEALACFTQLQVSYPDDPRAAQFLETARLRAAMSTGLQRGARVQTRSIWLRRLSWLGVVLVIGLIGLAVYAAYQTWAVPAQAESARQTRIAQLRQTAEVQIASGQYADANRTFQRILSEAPDDPEATAGLARAQKLEQAAGLYAQASQALGDGRQAEAKRLLEELSSIEPNYRDAADLIQQIESTQASAQKFDAAVRLYQSGNWQDAAQAFESLRAANPSFKADEVAKYLFDAYVSLGDQQIEQAETTAAIEVADGYYQRALTLRPLDPKVVSARRIAQAFLGGAESFQAKDWDDAIRKLSVVYEYSPTYFGGKVAEWLFEAFMTTGDAFLGQGDPFSARDRFAEAVRLAPGEAQQAEAQKKYNAANRLTTPTPTPRPSPTPLPAGYVAPAWSRRVTGTPDPYPFVLIATTYLPNTITGEGCKWAGVAGRIFDRQGKPLVLPTLGVRVTGPIDQGAGAGQHPVIGESGWIVQFDVRAKEAQGWVQVFYKDQPASQLIPWYTRNSCYENMLIMDLQQVKALP